MAKHGWILRTGAIIFSIMILSLVILSVIIVMVYGLYSRLDI